MKNKLLSLSLVILILSLVFTGCVSQVNIPEIVENETIENNKVDIVKDKEEETLDEDGIYFSPEEVAEYIHIYKKLPKNYITKKEARDLGWESEKGNLWDVTNQMSIGGDSFGNREGLLPKADGRKYFECDVNYSGGFRGSERIVYSNDGLIYYTKDHYKTLEKLY